MPHVRPILLAALLLASCGQDETSQPTVTSYYVKDPSDGPRDRDARLATCKKGERAFALTGGSEVQWTAMKSGDVPVVGTHGVKGRLAIDGSGDEETAQLSLTFDLSGAMTQLSIRDERIRKYIFGTDEGHELTFTSTGVETVDGEASTLLPTDEGVRHLRLRGKLALAGTEIPLVLPIQLSGSGTTLQVKPGLDGIRLDVREELGLSTALDALLALAGVEMESEIELRFALSLADACR